MTFDHWKTTEPDPGEGYDKPPQKGRGLPKPPPTKKFSATFTPDTYLAMNDYAVRERCSMATVVRLAVAEFLSRHRA